MKLLIVESPAKAKTINKYLGRDFKVISSYGHIRCLPSENGAVDPEKGFAMRYEINEGTEKRVNEIISYVKKSDEIYLATDPDREGEAISWHIIEVLKERKVLKESIPIKRVVFYEITKKAVLEAIANSRNLNIDLVNAQQARQGLDYLVGFTLSPVLWRKLPGSRSAGRVQSVALRIIAEREGEIEKFKIEEYWTIVGIFQSSRDAIFSGQLTHFENIKLEKFSIRNEEEATRIGNQLLGISYHVADIIKRQSKRNPNPPFTTATLIQESSRKFGFSAKKTSQIAQKLYEGIAISGEMIGLITYMRTDSVNVSQEAINAARELITKTYSADYLPKTPRIYKTKAKNAQEAHEAIRPTNVTQIPKNIAEFLEPDQLKLYDLIWKRLIASQMESAVLDSVSADIKSQDLSITWRATGSTITFPGFYILYREDKDEKEQQDDDDEKLLPPLSVSEIVKLNDKKQIQHFTQPPPRYTEASLVKGMEELGIGRPSTYPTIISILQTRGYVTLDKRRFITEPLGRLVNAFLTEFFAKYVEYSFTATLEDQLDNVASGEQNWKGVMEEFWYPFKEKTDAALKISNIDVLSHIEKSLEYYIFANSGKKCPSCEEGILELKTSKFGSFIGCSSYPKCNYTRKLHSSVSGDAAGTASSEQPSHQHLGHDQDGREITLRRGPYGPYLQAEKEGDAKAKRMPIPQGLDIKNIDLQYAMMLLSLPRILGNDPDSNEPIKVSIGRFGPYVECNKIYASITKKSGINFLEITLQPALELIKEKIAKGPSNRKIQKAKPKAVKNTKAAKSKKGN